MDVPARLTRIGAALTARQDHGPIRLLSGPELAED